MDNHYWVKNLGFHLIKECSLTIGNATHVFTQKDMIIQELK